VFIYLLLILSTNTRQEQENNTAMNEKVKQSKYCTNCCRVHCIGEGRTNAPPPSRTSAYLPQWRRKRYGRYGSRHTNLKFGMAAPYQSAEIWAVDYQEKH